MEINPNWLRNLTVVFWFMIGTFALFAFFAWLKHWWRKKTGKKPSLRDRLVQHGVYPTIKDDEIGKEIKGDGDDS